MPNHLNTSELFSSNPGKVLQRGCDSRSDYASDSAFNSSPTLSSCATNSQVMGSQMENSQSSSFDLFSQMMSQQQGYSQQNESTSSSFYMKYMSKPPLFQKENSSKKHSLHRRKSFQGMQELNRERAKERDDRDLFNTFIAIVKDCADEVKHAASSIKKDVDTNISETTTRTAAVMSKIANELAHHQRQLLDSLKTREDHEAKIQELMETIASKDAQIQILESQLSTARTDRNEHLLKAMLDMYTEQQSVTRQHLDKVHEEQQSIKDQQTKLLEETEKSHVTLSKIRTGPYYQVESSERRNPVERDTGRPVCSSVPPLAIGTSNTRGRHHSGSGWISGPEQSRMATLPQDNHNRSYSAASPRYGESSISYPSQGKNLVYQSSSQQGDLGARFEISRGSLNSSSHLFQHQSGTYPPNQHQVLSSADYAMQPVTRPGNSFPPQGLFNQDLLRHNEQPNINTKNPLQDHHNLYKPSTYLTTNKKQSCYDHFANKFSSPNYSSSDRQLWSKKNLKPSPVAAVAPQTQKEPCDDDLQDTKTAPMTRKQNRQKRSRKGAVESTQPQRKSARLSARTSPGNENVILSSRSDRKEEAWGAKGKRKPQRRARTSSNTHLEKENESHGDDSESEAEATAAHWKQPNPCPKSARRNSIQQQPTMKNSVEAIMSENDSQEDNSESETEVTDAHLKQHAPSTKCVHHHKSIQKQSAMKKSAVKAMYEYENQKDDSESEAEVATSHWKQNEPSAKALHPRSCKSVQKQTSGKPAPQHTRQQVRVERDSHRETDTANAYWKRSAPSSKTALCSYKSVQREPAQKLSPGRHTKTRQMSSIVIRQNDSSSDLDDEYTFHDDSEDQSEQTATKAFHTLKKSTSCDGAVKLEAKEVFTKRSVITYATPKPAMKKCTPLQLSAYTQRPSANSVQGKKMIQDNSWQESNIAGKLSKKSVSCSQDVDILDTIQTYTQSEDEESSQEIQFSLILPDARDLKMKNPGPPRWSSMMSPSAKSHCTEQVVPDQTLPQPKRSGKKFTSNRKRRMIYGSRDDLRLTVEQLISPI